MISKYLRYKVLFFILFIGLQMKAQKFVGFVVDNENTPLVGASVYFDGTSIGTSTDYDGNFQIIVPSETTATLVISYVGYEKFYLKNFDLSKIYTIKLVEISEKLNEIIVTNSSFTRKEMQRTFNTLFLGNTEAGKACKIENESDLYFSYNEEDFIFKAWSEKPLVIQNSHLGYKVYFDLTNFEAKFNRNSISSEDLYSSIYIGTSRFEEIDNRRKRKKNREKAYEGSLMQFMRNLASNKWTSECFLIAKNGYISNSSDYFNVSDTIGGKFVEVIPHKKANESIDFVSEIMVSYQLKVFSKIIFHTDHFVIDRFGLFSNYDKIYFAGELGNRKIGDMLPSNYGFE